MRQNDAPEEVKIVSLMNMLVGGTCAISCKYYAVEYSTRGLHYTNLTLYAVSQTLQCGEGSALII
jgi:hypothetical protein